MKNKQKTKSASGLIFQDIPIAQIKNETERAALAKIAARRWMYLGASTLTLIIAIIWGYSFLNSWPFVSLKKDDNQPGMISQLKTNWQEIALKTENSEIGQAFNQLRLQQIMRQLVENKITGAAAATSATTSILTKIKTPAEEILPNYATPTLPKSNKKS